MDSVDSSAKSETQLVRGIGFEIIGFLAHARPTALLLVLDLLRPHQHPLAASHTSARTVPAAQQED